MPSQPHPILDRPLRPDQIVPFTIAVSLLAAVGVGAGYTGLSYLDRLFGLQDKDQQETKAGPLFRTASMEQGR